MTNLEKVKELRLKTGLGLFFCKKALQDTGWDLEQARAKLQGSGVRQDQSKPLPEGVVHSYTHSNRIAVIVEVRCETDFAARSSTFLGFATTMGLQLAATNPMDLEDLLKEPWIEDEKQTIGELLDSLRRILREEVRIERFVRMGVDGSITVWPSLAPKG